MTVLGRHSRGPMSWEVHTWTGDRISTEVQRWWESMRACRICRCLATQPDTARLNGCGGSIPLIGSWSRRVEGVSHNQGLQAGSVPADSRSSAGPQPSPTDGNATGWWVLTVRWVG